MLQQYCSPAFRCAVIHLDNGRDFVIAAGNKTDRAIYVKSVSLNGVKLKDMKISHRDILAGGTLEFVMSEKK